MFNSIRRFLDKRFERQYLFEVAKYFASNATFTDTFTAISSNKRSAYYKDLDLLIDRLYDSCANKLRELIPTARRIRRKSANNSESLVVVKCFATRDNEYNIIYGVKVWVKSGKHWITFNHYLNDWETVKFIPSESFHVIYYNSCDNYSFVCKKIDKVKDFFFVY